MASNVLYVEARASMTSSWTPGPRAHSQQSNRTFIDPTGKAYLDEVVHTLNAARAVAGIDCATYTIGAKEIGARTVWSQSGCAVGTVLNPVAILDSVQQLLDDGAQAIGGVSSFTVSQPPNSRSTCRARSEPFRRC